MGLLIGASVLTMLELFDFLIQSTLEKMASRSVRPGKAWEANSKPIT